MLSNRARRLGSGLFVALLLASPAWAEPHDGLPDRNPPFRFIIPDHEIAFPDGSSNVTWIGHLYNATDPVGPYLAVHKGGVWDFDTDIASTDSTQGWQAHSLPTRRRFEMPALYHYVWSFAWGNEIDRGNTPLALDRANRSFIATGIVGAWHQDDMVGVGGSSPIHGQGSAWCGLRAAGDLHRTDPLTGNGINGDLSLETGPGNEPEFPGYCNGWDQLLYKDFVAPPTGALTFTYRTDMSPRMDALPGGSGWFSPDPTLIQNYIPNTQDSLIAYVGSPRDFGVFDTDRRWLAETLDFSQPVQCVATATGKSNGDRTVTVPYGNAPVGPLVPVNGKLRVVFRVVTNRVASDQTTGDPQGYDSQDGAAMLDDVSINGGVVYGFESSTDITARSLDLDLNDTRWIATGRPPDAFGHIKALLDLLYEDPCGPAAGASSRCHMAGQVLAFGDADNAALPESFANSEAPVTMMESPTIDLAIHDGIHPNSQGLSSEEASRPCAILDFDFYPGFMGPEEAVGLFVAARYYGAGMKSPVTGHPIWSNVILSPFMIGSYLNQCVHESVDLSSMGIPFGNIDSLKVGFTTEFAGGWTGGTNLGYTHGTYVDNVRVGLVRGGALPRVAQEPWDHYQDTFPVASGTAPGSAPFDTATALLRTARNINPDVYPALPIPVRPDLAIPGDSLLAEATRYGDGVTSGVRVDLVFRIDPGPGNYTVRGDRTSPLREASPLRPFWGSYMSDPGSFGTPGGHYGGTRWDPSTWNSARMDTAEANVWPVASRGIGWHDNRTWMGTYHEADPKFSVLGLVHDICFLVDPRGPSTDPNIDCSGTPPAAYGAVPGQTKEGTKILPDGLFAPGTHIEYFVRRSTIENPQVFDLVPDTSRVVLQSPYDNASFDQERWNHVDVLPDLWKDVRFGGEGLACMLLVDACDRRGPNAALRGALDTLGYGANGAAQGWRISSWAKRDPDSTSNFLAANLGQYGLSYDQYDIGATESVVSGHLGVRLLDPATGKLAGRESTAGPTEAMLAFYYNTLLWVTGDLWDSGLLESSIPGSYTVSRLVARDEMMVKDFIASGTPSTPRNFWYSGEGSSDAYSSAASFDLLMISWVLSSVLGSYRDLTLPAAANQIVSSMEPLPPFTPSGYAYGLNHECSSLAQYMSVDMSAAPGTARVGDYETLGAYPPPGGTTAASVFSGPTIGGLPGSVVFDGFDIAKLTGNGAVPTSPNNLALNSSTDNGRRRWVDEVLGSLLGHCPPRGPVIAVGDVPGAASPLATYQALGAVPNPAPASAGARLRYTAPRNAIAALLVYDVVGQRIARLPVVGRGGEASCMWNGTRQDGGHVAPGVYFYRLETARGAPLSSARRVVLLAGRAR